ncbi:MAG: hypothetical protein A2233_05150 [Candidatus Kerfeldbacteria bacterium RIFOXYA2_FULL_38_24]|uniref:ATP-grasp domain-containing protein n=1 Tax=Candidatus Kerfeldbacteria bacterium RIFOXYB2_FULL_38_14 TaxID=1798547 RepID=A0A1G2BG64_9BACT|nr:MAG: hypothetical protein A2233_05150 [Candidatus Kerfeldbacteria bacterium RIFOXYA2_FULL_38_24]OGY88218.1 MAG: hypothetical protein A2319_03445 [Candidatus Kerfeldbacteria bacterium RIFOXYB2_FULL_38_14]OGY89766.1 MAG: hypothetical protein A2458_05440 [Candidatus Kerfeldbacteria bacterium RIFOXYC2_FULL_38_9]
MYKILSSADEKKLLSKKLIENQSDFFHLAAKKLGYHEEILACFTERGKDGSLIKRLIYKFSHERKTLVTCKAVVWGTSYIGMHLSSNKPATTKILYSHHIPVPLQATIKTKTDLIKMLKRHSPLVVKPADLTQGQGVVGNVTTPTQANIAFDIVKKTTQSRAFVIAEQQIFSKEFRVIVVNNRFAAAVYYQPPIIVGDGHSSIEALIKKENASKLRMTGWTDSIKVNKQLDFNLQAIGMTKKSIPHKNEQIVLHKVAPVSNGGILIDVTNTVCEENKKLFKKVSKLFGIDILGIDILAPSLEKSIVKTGGKIIEVNGGPDLGVHYNVHIGKRRNIAEIVLRNYFEPKRKLSQE